MDALQSIKGQIQHLYKRSLVAELAVYEENYDDFVLENLSNTYRQRQYVLSEALEAFPGGVQNWLIIKQAIDGTRWQKCQDETGAIYYQQLGHPEQVVK